MYLTVDIRAHDTGYPLCNTILPYIANNNKGGYCVIMTGIA